MIPVRAVAGFAVIAAVAAWSAAAGAETAAPLRPRRPRQRTSCECANHVGTGANIKEAAERIGTIQRTRGAEAAIKHIDACYRTHGLASAYSAPFEACIAQDYMQTKLLTRVYVA